MGRDAGLAALAEHLARGSPRRRGVPSRSGMRRVRDLAVARPRRGLGNEKAAELMLSLVRAEASK